MNIPPNNPIAIPQPQYPELASLYQQVADAVQPSGAPGSAVMSDAEEARQLEERLRAMIKAVTAMATQAWKANGRIVDPESGDPKATLNQSDVRRVFRAVSAILESARDAGFEIIDRTGRPFDYGLPERVIASQAVEGLVREQVVETIKPTIFWNGQMVQPGEIVIGVPPSNASEPRTPANP